MSIEITELWNSRTGARGESGRVVYRFRLEGSDDANAMRTALTSHALSTIGLTVEGLPYSQTEITEQWDVEIWQGTVTYATKKATNRQLPETGASIFQFDTGGATELTRVSRELIASYAPQGQTAPPNGVQIANGDGANRITKAFTFSVTKYLPDSAVNDSYKQLLYARSVTVNSSPITINGITFAAGELLFISAVGSKREDQDDWELRLNFAASPNLTNVVIDSGLGGGTGDITVASKDGWQIIDVKYEEGEVDGQLYRVPVAAYVHRLYEVADHSGIIPS